MYYFIVNPNSCTGRGLFIWNTVKKELDEKKLPYKAYLTEYEHHATELAKYVCNSVTGVKTIVVLGGDGTLNEVLNGISDLNEIILGYIPSGSSNDFARSLNIPSTPSDALELIVNPKHYEYVDIGELEVLNSKGSVTSYRRFVVSSGIGYDASVCYEALNSRLKKALNHLRLGKLTYILIALKQIFACKPVDGRLTVDGIKKSSYKNILLLVNMIHKYEGGGQIMAPRASYNDKQLSVCLVHNLSKLKMLFLLPTIISGKHVHFKGVETFNCKKLELTLLSPRITHTDGEYAGTNKQIRARCNRLSLRTYAPVRTR